MQDANLMRTPAEVKQIRVKEKYVLAPESTTYSRDATGPLLFMSCCTRPDLKIAIIISRSMSSPGKRAMTKLRRLLIYLRGTTELRTTYGKCRDGNDDKLIGYVDADYAVDPDEGFSTTGYVFYFAGGPLY
ncbi:unnamed protein product [Sphacelaria rigidula]